MTSGTIGRAGWWVGWVSAAALTVGSAWITLPPGVRASLTPWKSSGVEVGGATGSESGQGAAADVAGPTRPTRPLPRPTKLRMLTPDEVDRLVPQTLSGEDCRLVD